MNGTLPTSSAADGRSGAAGGLLDPRPKGLGHRVQTAEARLCLKWCGVGEFGNERK